MAQALRLHVSFRAQIACGWLGVETPWNATTMTSMASSSGRGPSLHGHWFPDCRKHVSRHRPDLHLAGHVGGGDAAAIRRHGDGVEPVLELAATRLAEFLDQLRVFEVPDLHGGVAADGEEMLAVGMKDQVGDAVRCRRVSSLSFLPGTGSRRVTLPSPSPPRPTARYLPSAEKAAAPMRSLCSFERSAFISPVCGFHRRRADRSRIEDQRDALGDEHHLPSGCTATAQAQPLSFQRRCSLPAGAVPDDDLALVVAGDHHVAVARQRHTQYPVLVLRQYLGRLANLNLVLDGVGQLLLFRLRIEAGPGVSVTRAGSAASACMSQYATV